MKERTRKSENPSLLRHNLKTEREMSKERKTLFTKVSSPNGQKIYEVVSQEQYSIRT